MMDKGSSILLGTGILAAVILHTVTRPQEEELVDLAKMVATGIGVGLLLEGGVEIEKSKQRTVAEFDKIFDELEEMSGWR